MPDTAGARACDARSQASLVRLGHLVSVGAGWYTPPMLQELRVENLLLIDRAELALAPGLNVVTGETGAGKTLLAQALDLLLGGRAGSGVVRAGAAEAYVEGVFSLPAELGGRRGAADRGRGDRAGAARVARRPDPGVRVRQVGDRRPTCASSGSALLAFYGQHEHRKLMLSAVQLDVLDAHCGREQMALREQVGEAYARVRGVEAREAELRELAAGRERELDLLAFELDEIESVAPTEDEARELAVERDRLRHLETLRGAAAGAAEAISPEDGAGGAAELLAHAAGQLAVAAGIDPSLSSLAERAAGARRSRPRI